jgi:hypothetical protein
VTLYDASGTASGTGDATVTPRLVAAAGGSSAGSGSSSFGPGQETHFARVNFAGAAGFSAAAIREMIFGGQTGGIGTLSDELLMLATGSLSGIGSVIGTATQIIYVSGTASGSGQIELSLPDVLVGFGNIVGFADIQHVPPPICRAICGCEKCCGRREEECHECFEWHRRRFHREPWWWQCRECWERHSWHIRDSDRDHEGHREHDHEWSRDPNPDGLIGEFRWNQTFGKGDLEICLRDRWGNQRGPVFIGYTMYMVTPTGILHQAGPSDRKPAKADVGKFYVTGTAGENGQPGCWAVKWRYQRTYSEPILERLVQFMVLDAVLDCDRRDPVRRHCKYGWDL